MASHGDIPAALEPGDSAALDERLRRQLGRRVNLVLIADSDEASAQVSQLQADLAPYTEMRVIAIPMSNAELTGNAATQALQRAANEDADVILIWIERPLHREETAHRLRVWLEEAEQLGLCDRGFLALIGPSVTRKDARNLGYEDGIPSATPPAQLATLVANEALARDELRRRGSSPPCYL